MNQDYKDSLNKEFNRGKKKFYSSPIFAAQAGIVVGVLGTLLVRWFFF